MVYICNNKLLLTELPSEESINVNVQAVPGTVHTFLSLGEQHLYNHFENAEYGYEEDQEMAESHSVNYCSNHPSS